MKDLAMKGIWRSIHKISAAIFKLDLNLWGYFEPLDAANHGVISEAKFIAILHGSLRSAVSLSEAEIAELADYFRLQDGRIHYFQMCRIVHESGTDNTKFLRREICLVPRFQSKNVITGLEWEDPSEVNRLSYSELRKLNLIMTQIAVNIKKRELVLRPYFQDYELIAKNVGSVTITHFGRVLNFLGITLGSDEFALVVKRFAKGPYLINYVSFVQAIEEVQNCLDMHGMLHGSGELSAQFSGRIITAELPKLPRPECGALRQNEAFSEQEISRSLLNRSTTSMTIQETIHRIQKHVFERRIRVREYFQIFDALNVGRVTQSQFKRGLDALQVSGLGQLYLSEIEIDNLVDFYKDPNDPERVMWRVFEDDIDHVFSVKGLEKLPQLQFESPPRVVAELPKRGSVSWQNAPQSLRDLCEETLRKIRFRVEERRIMLKQFFKNYDKLNHGYVSKVQVHQALTTATILLSYEEMSALEHRYNDDMGFNYAWFLRDLVPISVVTPPPEAMHNKMRLLKAGSCESVLNDEKEDIVQILSKIKAKVVRERIEIKDSMRHFDSRNEMIISTHDFARGLDQLRCNLTHAELATLINTYSAPLRPGFVEYIRFNKAIQEVITIGSLEKSPLLVPLPHVPSEACSRAFLNFEERQTVAQAMNKIANVPSPNMEEIFKDFDKCNMGTVTKNQLIKTLSVRRILQMISNKELNAVFKCFTVESRDKQFALDYRSFLRALEFLKNNKKYLHF